LKDQGAAQRRCWAAAAWPVPTAGAAVLSFVGEVRGCELLGRAGEDAENEAGAVVGGPRAKVQHAPIGFLESGPETGFHVNEGKSTNKSILQK